MSERPPTAAVTLRNTNPRTIRCSAKTMKVATAMLAVAHMKYRGERMGRHLDDHEPPAAINRPTVTSTSR
jgi:hypothetical protein